MFSQFWLIINYRNFYIYIYKNITIKTFQKDFISNLDILLLYANKSFSNNIPFPFLEKLFHNQFNFNKDRGPPFLELIRSSSYFFIFSLKNNSHI